MASEHAGGGMSDARLAASLAEEAGRRLVALRGSWAAGGTAAGARLRAERRTRLRAERRTRAGGPDLGSRGDLLSNELILRDLAAARPGDAVLSEESPDDRGRLAAQRVWIVDPLDGTREYALPGRDDWAVHVALWERRRGITAAAVALPAIGEVWSSDQAAAPARPPQRRPRVVVSESRPPAFAPRLAASVGADLVPLGSAGAKAMAVVRGDADAYVHAGGQWEWDSAAPVGVVLAAGLHASRLDGSELVYNQPRPYVPDLLICRPALAEELITVISGLLGPPEGS
ncbi:MAG: 3'(2'),5'-bisphosphate nucleotidase CysQ [Acidimicrobiales bacterium]